MRWRAGLDRALAPLGLTSAQYGLLASLGALSDGGDPPSQRELADFSGLEPMFVAVLFFAFAQLGGSGRGETGLLFDPATQSAKLIAIRKDIEPLPMLIANPVPILLAYLGFGVGHALVYRSVAGAWRTERCGSSTSFWCSISPRGSAFSPSTARRWDCGGGLLALVLLGFLIRYRTAWAHRRVGERPESVVRAGGDA